MGKADFVLDLDLHLLAPFSFGKLPVLEIPKCQQMQNWLFLLFVPEKNFTTISIFSESQEEIHYIALVHIGYELEMKFSDVI